MATKTQRFRAESERSGAKRPKAASAPVHKKEAGSGSSTAGRNRSTHAARKGGVKLEDSQTKPSRKSTRGGHGREITVSANKEGIDSKRRGTGHVKSAAPLTLRATLEARSSSERAQRGKRPARKNAPRR